ncbi:undecaprenyl-diphosphate phosphatase [Mangrovitalea sediminis]|uniref:undecaprenyl-diphosphate phosphatase n=1 Tax=Mangrovitalea sediminis TaxID=1982043 RepID=UPI000BE50750|nr:undecaprenyl-diphosphate phosphatase [Mangrovitalea sediminis]
MNAIHVLLFAIMQGITELFPISSLGHGVIAPSLLGWDLNRDNPNFLPLLVVLHLGTATALLLYFRRDWIRLIGGVLRQHREPSNPEAKVFWLLVMATVPAGLLGLLLEKKLRLLFGNAELVSGVLAINGIVLWIGDRLKNRSARHTLETMGWQKAVGIGFAQALALIPGMSRSGVTLVAGLASGLDYAASARFSFLMATPIILAAGVLEVPKLLHHGLGTAGLGVIAAAGVLAGIFAWLSTWVLMRWFSSHEVQALRPFAVYCLLAGLGALTYLLAGG